MPSLKDLRNRISSVQATRKITRAMQMVAASKLRRAQEAAEAARPYAGRMEAVLANLAHNIPDPNEAPPLMAGTGKQDVHLLLVATAERGLCGGFNTSIVKCAREQAEKILAQGKTFKILCIGTKGADQLKRFYPDRMLDVEDLSGTQGISFANTSRIAANIVNRFTDGEFDVCTLFYSRFESVISQVPTAQQLIPAPVFNEKEDTQPSSHPAQNRLEGAFEYEPEEDEILETLLPRNISVQIFRGLLENAASEQGARMTAMDNATRNAGDMINDLTLQYNRSRQAQITKELIEIISGAEAI